MSELGRLLIVDDEPDVGTLLAEVAKGSGFQVKVISGSLDFPDAFQTFHPNLILLDLMMPDLDGLQILRSLAEAHCDAHIILASGADGRVLNATARIAGELGLTIKKILRKPIAVEDLEAVLGDYMASARPLTADELRSAIERKQIYAHFQPKLDLSAGYPGTTVGIEALARWDHPVRGAIPPSEFIPIAERSGLISGLTDLVIEDALTHAQALQAEGHAIDLAINLSPAVVANPTFADSLGNRIEAFGIRPSSLIVEITESVAMTDHSRAMENLTRYRLKGMRLSLDDFGIGYSSLLHLHRMPFSELKIDRAFVSEVDTDEDAKTVVRSTVELAHALGLTVCAEGVESRRILNFLRMIGCDQAQGFYISTPLPGAAMIDFLERNSKRGAETKTRAITNDSVAER